ncbi:Endothelial PAS domain-containing protein 1 [Holothuria leucospilota]|uniref:Endothelial PAS domain-containing protein 1 n=1 Tax=Holothuria leucospilota TaxID=206669 RepID=A0A9Q1HGV0_HOLLE|nr:Endothelial PAS domain-containing protein 1 [Holothuria leucospilota]
MVSDQPLKGKSSSVRNGNRSRTSNPFYTALAEKSRHAAKMRRDKESEEISALSKLLPYPEEVTSRLDKGSVIRLATSFLRMKKYSQKEGDALLEELKSTVPKSEKITKDVVKADVADGNLMMQAWNGFVIFVSRKGQIYFISENASKHLGIHQYEMLGKSVLDFIHPDDHKELAKQFMVSVPGQQTFKGYGMEGTKDRPTAMSINFFNQTDEEYVSVSDFVQERSFFLRMRSVMSKKSSSGKGKVMGYRVVNFSGRLKLKSSPNNSGFTVEGLICLCRPIQPLPVLEIRMDGNMFMSRHGMDMSFTFCDPRIITLIGYEPHELIGKTAYQFHNPLDARKVSDCHSNLIVKGSSMSKYYRFLGKTSQWVWMRTKATIIYNTSGVAQYVVAMNYVVGKEEGERMLMLERMQEAIESPPSCSSDGEAYQSPQLSPTQSSPSPENDIHEPLKAEDVAHYIPAAVCQHQPIIKPPTENVDFSSLVPEKKSNLSAVPVQRMDTTEYLNSSPSVVQMEGPPAPSQGYSTSSSVNPQPSLPHMFQTELSKSDSPQSDLESVSSGSTGSVSSPCVLSVSDMKGSSERESDNRLEDIMDVTNSIQTVASTSAGLVVSSQMFGSPGSGSSFADSPCSPTSGNSFLEDFVENEVFKHDQTSNMDRNGSCGDFLKKLSGSQQVLSVSVTDLTPFDTEQSLPQDIADFSLEFFNKLIDQSAQDAVTVMGNDLEFSDSSDLKINASSSFSTTNGAVITELPNDTPVTQGSTVYGLNNTTSQTNVNDGSGQVPLPYSEGQYSSPTHNTNQFSPPTQSHHSASIPRNVTDGLSKLKIKDSRQQTSGTASPATKSLLKALLTGREGNPLANSTSCRPGVNSNSPPIGNSSGIYYPRTGAPPPVSTAQCAPSEMQYVALNNNILGQDDLGIYERQRQQRLLLEHHQRQQQSILLQNQLQEQQLLERQQQQQLMQEVESTFMSSPPQHQDQTVMGGFPRGPSDMMGIPQNSFVMQEMGVPVSSQQRTDLLSTEISSETANVPFSAQNFSSGNSQMMGEMYQNLQMNGSCSPVSLPGPYQVQPLVQPVIQNGTMQNNIPSSMLPQFQTNGASVVESAGVKCNSVNSASASWMPSSSSAQPDVASKFIGGMGNEGHFLVQGGPRF